MASPVGVANLALIEMGGRIQITSFDDPTPQAQAANAFYQPKLQALIRSANWDFTRAQITLTVWKQLLVNGGISANPPPQPWQFSYLYPPDCLKARFVLPTLPLQAPGTPLTTAPNSLVWSPPVPTAIPFVRATDFDTNGNPISVILTQLQNAQLIYTRDLSMFPDLWDPLFLTAATALLASYFINALARNAKQMEDQVAIAKDAIAQARIANGNEAINSIDRIPDFIRARYTSGYNWAFNANAPSNYGGLGGFESIEFPNGLRY